ncbi:MAG: phosphatidylserine decarboxylase family protein [Candidatus Riflebacteria bacterium]|nr:phosphatidylserine decarboxylase family protein [Candidatus Riflebacteria bacterium]
MRSPIHKEGFKFAGGFFALGFLTSYLNKWIGRFFYVLSAFSLYFFRDPERKIPSGEGLILSPADGRVIDIDTVDHAPFIDGPAKRVTIFLSLFDVHINRSPIKGKIAYRQYAPGKFMCAFEPKASTENEQNAVGIEGSDGYRVLVKQIAGLVARRIVCWKNPGDETEIGERFGLIRFGSRTEIFMPLDAKIDVKIGQKVSGASTIIARR